jgi:hypothetical protein
VCCNAELVGLDIFAVRNSVNLPAGKSIEIRNVRLETPLIFRLEKGDKLETLGTLLAGKRRKIRNVRNYVIFGWGKRRLVFSGDPIFSCKTCRKRLPIL